MIQFKDSHKEIRISSSVNKDTVEWFNEDGELEKINVQALSDDALFSLKSRVSTWYQEQMSVIDGELNNWQPIYCSVCGEEDLSYRGRPFVTWGLRGGYVLCPRHTRAYDRFGTPEAKLLAEARAEEAEIKELFG